MLWPVVAETTAQRPISRPSPQAGGSTAIQKLRDSAAQSRRGAAAPVFEPFWLVALADAAPSATVLIALDGAAWPAGGDEESSGE
ncbi:hypothetical protein Acidovoranil_20170 [Acidovorax sp. FG27]